VVVPCGEGPTLVRVVVRLRTFRVQPVIHEFLESAWPLRAAIRAIRPYVQASARADTAAGQGLSVANFVASSWK
jgi:hypothetical protein